MENEIINYVKACLQVITSLSYCFLIGKLLPSARSFLRLFLLLPVFCFFLYLPLVLHSVHLIGFFAFSIAWLANFKLFLFAFNKGPLSHPSLSFPCFLAVASFPIKIHETISSQKNINNQMIGQKCLMNYSMKVLIVAGLVISYEHKEHFHPKLLLTLYSIHIYLSLEIFLAVIAAMSRTLLGVELEPQFNKPYLSSSLQNFWGRRWNIIASKILRATVYEPAYGMSVRIIGRKWASLPAVFITFVVSGFVHELIYYYLGRVRPTWEVTWFFILHGLRVAVEIWLKKQVSVSGGSVRLPGAMSVPLTVGFVLVTAFRLFFPQLLRCNIVQRGLQEYASVIAFLKNVTRFFDVYRAHDPCQS